MANNFTGDANCKALWSFDNGALTTDSIGSNTLTNISGCTADTGDYKEGDASLNLVAPDDYMTITDANLQAGYPMKNGDTNVKISICAWVKYDILGSNDSWYSKYNDTTGPDREIMVCIVDDSGYKFRAYLGHNADGGVGRDAVDLATLVPVAGQWYHTAFTYQDSDQAWVWRVYDQTADTVYTSTGTMTDTINVAVSPVKIGRWETGGEMDGRIDELVVFDDILEASEIDKIRNGTYGSNLVPILRRRQES